jgi:AAA domain
MAKPLATISERVSATVHRPVSRMVSALPYAEAALRGEYQEVAATGTGDRNARLNVAALKLGGLVAAGELSETEVVNTLYDAATANGMVADDGPRAAVATINSGMRKGLQEPRRIPERETKLEVLKPEPRAILATPYIWKDPTSLRRREWLYGYLLIRKFVTATVAPGGVGKSSLGTVESLAQVTGKDLLGVLPPRPLRVWLWNLEDPQEETERKIQAAAMHYGLTAEDIGDRLFVDSGRDQPLVIATTTRNGAVIAHPVVDSLVAEIIKRKIDVIKIDPFVSCHEASENDNQAMDLIVKEWGRVADRANCAVELYDHTRKMGGTETEVTVESSRGAKSKTDACRVVRAINRMTKDEGARAGIENHRLYFKTFNDKANLQPPADKAEWFELVSVDLGNGPLHGPGDSVGVVTKWEWPDPLAGMTGGAFDKVAASIRAGKFRESPQANAWVGNAVAEALDLNAENRADKAKIIGMLKVWLSAGSLVAVEDYDDTRRLRKFIEVRAE